MSAFKAYQLTLNGNAQRLSDIFGDGVGVVNAANDIPFRTVTFQGLKANTNDIFVSDANTISSTIHGFRVDSTDSALPIILGGYDSGGIKLSNFWVLGINAEVLLISGIPY